MPVFIWWGLGGAALGAATTGSDLMGLGKIQRIVRWGAIGIGLYYGGKIALKAIK